MPAGMTLRKLIVKVTLMDSDEDKLYSQEAQLGKVFEDREGTWPVMGWKASELRIDNSINPLEKRMIIFKIPKHGKAKKINLHISYSHFPGDEDPVVIFSDTRDI